MLADTCIFSETECYYSKSCHSNSLPVTLTEVGPTNRMKKALHNTANEPYRSFLKTKETGNLITVITTFYSKVVRKMCLNSSLNINEKAAQLLLSAKS